MSHLPFYFLMNMSEKYTISCFLKRKSDFRNNDMKFLFFYTICSENKFFIRFISIAYLHSDIFPGEEML